MAGVRIDDRGLSRFQRQLKSYGVTADELKDVMFKIGNKVANDAKSLAPVRTGALRDSIRASKAQRTAVIRAGSAKVPYSSFNEWGTGAMDGTEFVTRAIEQNEDYAAKQVDAELDALARRYGVY